MHSLYFDGASRSNPGPSSYGGVIYDENNIEVGTYYDYIGKATNNVAEYLALFAGLKACKDNNIKNLKVYGDSKLVIEQVKGNWNVKSENLKPIYNEIKELLNNYKFDHIEFNHILRKYNKRADELANIALGDSI
jgi:ribonuclease HI